MSSINKHKLQTDQNIPFKSCICRKSQIPQFQLEATLRNIQYVWLIPGRESELRIRYCGYLNERCYSKQHSPKVLFNLYEF